jgi:uncharacterized protein with HEPN domain
MNERDKNVLFKIKKEIGLLLELTVGHDLRSFLGSELVMRAVCLTLINIGELVKLLTEEIKHQNSAIPWRAIAGLRDVTAHGYYTLRMEDVWETITKEIPLFLTQIEEILKQYDSIEDGGRKSNPNLLQ